MIDDKNVWHGRFAAYLMFADFFRNGLSDGVRDVLSGLVDRDVLVPDAVNGDECAATHFEVLGLNVIPHSGWYLDADGLLGGISNDTAVRATQPFMSVDSLPGQADHISGELELLARMCELELQGQSTSVEQSLFMDRHFLWWVLPFAYAVSRSGIELYDAVAQLMVGVILDHRAALTVDYAGTMPLPPVEDILDRTETGFSEIARRLSSTALSGIVLTRGRIESLARSLQMPRGFGSRRQMLSNLLTASVQYDQLHDVLRLIADEGLRWRAHYESLGISAPEVTGPIVSEWMRRIDGTLSMLDRLRSDSSNAEVLSEVKTS